MVHKEVRCSSDFAENPINSFHLLYRFAVEWPNVFQLVHCENCIFHDSIRSKYE